MNIEQNDTIISNTKELYKGVFVDKCEIFHAILYPDILCSRGSEVL